MRPRISRANPLIVAACLVSFATLINGDEEQKFYRDLSRLYSAPEAKIFHAQVKRWTPIHSATARRRWPSLRKMGVPALKLLKAETSKPHSPEARQRIEKLIDELRNADQPKNLVLEAELLKHLKAAKNKRADSIIDALASNTGDAWIVRGARAIRDRRKK